MDKNGEKEFPYNDFAILKSIFKSAILGSINWFLRTQFQASEIEFVKVGFRLRKSSFGKSSRRNRVLQNWLQKGVSLVNIFSNESLQKFFFERLVISVKNSMLPSWIVRNTSFDGSPQFFYSGFNLLIFVS